MKSKFILMIVALACGSLTLNLFAEDKPVFENMKNVETLAEKIMELGEETKLSCSCVSCAGNCDSVHTIKNLAIQINEMSGEFGTSPYQVWRVKFVDMGESGWNDFRDAIVFEFFQDGELTVWTNHYGGSLSLMPDLVMNKFGAETASAHVDLTLMVLQKT